MPGPDATTQPAAQQNFNRIRQNFSCVQTPIIDTGVALDDVPYLVCDESDLVIEEVDYCAQILGATEVAEAVVRFGTTIAGSELVVAFEIDGLLAKGLHLTLPLAATLVPAAGAAAEEEANGKPVLPAGTPLLFGIDSISDYTTEPQGCFFIWFRRIGKLS